MAATPLATTLLCRHQGRLWINLASRCARIQFQDLPLIPTSTVTLSWFYCYDPNSAHPDWKELKGADATTEVQLGGTADFVLVFGPSSPATDPHKPHQVSAMILTRPDAETIAACGEEDKPILPTLSYVLRGPEGFKSSGRIQLKGSWNSIIFEEAVEIFGQNTIAGCEEFLDKEQIGPILESYWDARFMYLRKSAQLKEKRRGKVQEEAPQLEDDEFPSTQPVIPKLNPEVIERLLLIGSEAETVPPMISRRVFCGKSATEGISIWRAFQSMLELVGRSLFLRQLYNAGQLYLLGPQETVEIHTDKLAELGQPLVYFFRVPRSAVNEPALVIELFEVIHSHDDTTVLKPVRPTPYVTASQLERAKGNPLLAFANLESVHHEKLKVLTSQGLLQPPNIRLKPVLEGMEETTTSQIPIYPVVTALPRAESRWWSAADLAV